MTAADFPHLLAPLDHGRLHLKNRVVFPGHQTLLSEGGVIGERMLGYYVERAKGGVGAVIVEGAAVHRTTVKFTDYLLAYDPRIIPTLDRLADRLHEHDCRAILQLAHSGSRMSTFDSRRELWAPSAVQAAISPEMPHAMTLAEIDELLGQLDHSAPYPGADAEGQRGRSGHPKRTALPDKWLESREVASSATEMMRGAEIENSGG